ncbi:hypothetical protein [Vibrio parahaemolyticus]|uniref:hypothetical protein n=1 Tax=Vibrio parahaemolyticus TaxID=670 RepID=UPI001122650D|nr:hypothetical protein [Vibrio parahaemolyticus]
MKIGIKTTKGVNSYSVLSKALCLSSMLRSTGNVVAWSNEATQVRLHRTKCPYRVWSINFHENREINLSFSVDESHLAESLFSLLNITPYKHRIAKEKVNKNYQTFFISVIDADRVIDFLMDSYQK